MATPMRGRDPSVELQRISDAGGCKVWTWGRRFQGMEGRRIPIPEILRGTSPRNLRRRSLLYVKNMENDDPGFGTVGSTFYIGGPDVTPDNGWPLVPQDFIVLNVTERIQIYMVYAVDVGGVGVDVRTMEVA